MFFFIIYYVLSIYNIGLDILFLARLRVDTGNDTTSPFNLELLLVAIHNTRGPVSILITGTNRLPHELI